MSGIRIHSTTGSPPCRAVLMTAKALGIQPKVIELNLFAGDTKTPEFQKLNPQHSVPVMEDKGLILAESRAIMEYLCDGYGTTDSLYPRDIKQRALVHARLYFDSSTLYARVMLSHMIPLLRGTEASEETLETLKDSLAVLDTYIGNNDFLVGKKLTIADISIAVTVSNLEVFDYDLSPYKNVSRWLENMKSTIPGYEEINQKGINLLIGFRAQKLANK